MHFGYFFDAFRQLDYFAVSLLGVVFLYPAAYAVLLGLQVLRDASWSPKERPLGSYFVWPGAADVALREERHHSER